METHAIPPLRTCQSCGEVLGHCRPGCATLRWAARRIVSAAQQPEAPQAELTPRVDALLLETNEGRRYATEGPLATLARNLEAANARLIRDANTSNRLIGERCEQLEAELAASRERERALREAIKCDHDGEPCGDGVCCHCGEPYETRNESDDGPYLCDQCAQDAIGRFRALATPDSAASPTGGDAK